jgi:AcrR family transcriptional regulator
MADIGHTDDPRGAGDLAVREPRQRRTREQWERILDAGVQLVEKGGYEAFTIAALCDAAGVPPRALYARAATKDALFLAVYERGMAKVHAGEVVFADRDAWDLADPLTRIEQAVRRLVQIFIDNADFLRAVVLVSGVHPEVRRRGEAYRSRIGELFTSVLTPVTVTPTHADPARARDFCFSMVFSAMVVRTAYGPGFGHHAPEPASEDLTTMVQRYLLDTAG